MQRHTKIKSIINNLILSLILVFSFALTANAQSTYKANQPISFGRTYEFDNPSQGQVVLSGAYSQTIYFGDIEQSKFEDKVAVSAAFVPQNEGVYRLLVEITGISENGETIQRYDAIYFVVTQDGRDMEDGEIETLINESIANENFVDDELVEYSRPYLEKIELKNAKLVEEYSKDRTEYTLVVDKNSQEIIFDVVGNEVDTKVEGIFTINPTEQQINIISVSNKTATVIYTFRWETPELIPFLYTDENGIKKELYYFYKPLSEYQGLESEEMEIKGEKYTVLKDQMGNLLIPLKEKFSSQTPDLYTFSPDGTILNKFGKFININGEVYMQESFKKIFSEDQRLFNLEETDITELNSARGYKINRIGYENYYLVRLTRPDGLSAWYYYNKENKELTHLDLPDNLFEDSLSKLFGIDLETNYNTFKYSYYDLGLIAIAFIALIIVIYLSYRGRG